MIKNWGGTSLVIFCLSALLGGCLDGKRDTGPYNNLVWNRENVLAGHGQEDIGPWFEWWYYKVILPDTGDAFYFVYGVVNPWDRDGEYPASRAYVGFGNFIAQEQIHEIYPVTAFTAAYDRTNIDIASQHATDTLLSGSIAEGDNTASWDITISNLWDFNATGWAMFVPELTNIYWYPAQAAALFSGTIFHNGREYTFENVPGYQDRNWGRSFPGWWAWITANHFQGHPDTILAAGGGQPTILDRVNCVEGLAIGLKHKGNTYEFRPNDGDWERVTVNFGTWDVLAVNRDGYKIEIEAFAPCESFMDLVFTTPDGVQFHDFETLTGSLTVRLYKWEVYRYRLLETLTSDFAGIEYGSANAVAEDCYVNEVKVLFDNFD